MKKRKYFLPVLAFITIFFFACANSGNAPGPNDSTDNSLPTTIDRDSLKDALTDTLYDSKDTMHP